MVHVGAGACEVQKKVKPKKYLVTGGSGFIGSAIVKRLVKAGNEVRVLDNDLRGASERLKEVARKIELVQADIRDAEAVRKACRGVDSVIHLAYLQGTQFFYTKPELVLDIGVKGMINVIDGCIKENVKEIAVASSSEVYNMPPKIPTDETAPLTIPDPLNPRYSYSAGKIISEMMAINYGRKHFDRALIFRPHNVYGPDMGWEHVIPQLTLKIRGIAAAAGKTIKVPIQGTGKETRAFIYIEDFADGLMILLEKGEHLGIYHIGTMDEMTIADVAKEIGNYFGKIAEIVPGKAAKGSPARRCPDTTKLKKLGFKTKTPFREGLAMTAKWYDQNADKQPKVSSEGGRLYER
ncbi:SDR family NAD(P)-dependent oxidoreductase [Candidatus Woesearchaeota archaeon]|nr:SDR family NAD(P)-dependent oxidoreductase [Candidatus Woesearchaeota archaeon]